MPVRFSWRLVLFIATIAFSIYTLHGGKAQASPAKPCGIGQFCISQTASSSPARVGQIITFTASLKNNSENDLGNLMLRLTTPRQVTVKSATVPFTRHGVRQLRWHIAHMVSGEFWIVKVMAEVSAPSSTRVTNTLFLYFDGSPWLQSRISYRLER